MVKKNCSATKNFEWIRWNKYSLFFFSDWAIFNPLPSSSRALDAHKLHLAWTCPPCLVCVRERISMILPGPFKFNLHLYAHTMTRTHTQTHRHTHAPTQKKNTNTATHINWDFMNFISSGYTCVLHGLLPIHLKSNQTKKYIPSVELSLTGGFAATTWAPFKQTSIVGACVQFETGRKRIQQLGRQAIMVRAWWGGFRGAAVCKFCCENFFFFFFIPWVSAVLSSCASQPEDSFSVRWEFLLWRGESYKQKTSTESQRGSSVGGRGGGTTGEWRVRAVEEGKSEVSQLLTDSRNVWQVASSPQKIRAAYFWNAVAFAITKLTSSLALHTLPLNTD